MGSNHNNSIVRGLGPAKGKKMKHLIQVNTDGVNAIIKVLNEVRFQDVLGLTQEEHVQFDAFATQLVKAKQLEAQVEDKELVA